MFGPAVSLEHFKFKSHSGESYVLIPLVAECSICQVSLSFEKFSFNYLNIISFGYTTVAESCTDCNFSYTIYLYGWQSESDHTPCP